MLGIDYTERFAMAEYSLASQDKAVLNKDAKDMAEGLGAFDIDYLALQLTRIAEGQRQAIAHEEATKPSGTDNTDERDSGGGGWPPPFAPTPVPQGRFVPLNRASMVDAELELAEHLDQRPRVQRVELGPLPAYLPGVQGARAHLVVDSESGYGFHTDTVAKIRRLLNQAQDAYRTMTTVMIAEDLYGRLDRALTEEFSGPGYQYRLRVLGLIVPTGVGAADTVYQVERGAC